MGKKNKNKKVEPYVSRNLYVYDTTWWVGFEDARGKTYYYNIPSVDTFGKILDKFDDVYDVRVFTKETVYPFTIY